VILFATDFSTVCDNAWPYAVALANEYGSKLLLAHVIDPNIFAAVPRELGQAAREQVLSDRQLQLRRLRQFNGGPQLDSELLLQEGEIAEVLLRMIQEHDVELLVAGTRGYSRTERLLLGSVAEKLFRQASCPVLVVPEQAKFEQRLIIRRIVCPIDFSPESPAAVEFAGSIARHYGAQLVLVHVLAQDASGTKEKIEQTRTEAEDRLRGLLDRGQDLPFESQLEITTGIPAERISRITTEYHADLVIISVHAASGTAAHERERTAYRVIRWSLAPVLTIPKSRSTAG
jgi:nucleotide-binding universal stress UspA family protein